MKANQLQVAIEKGFTDLRQELDARFKQVDERFNQVDDYGRQTRVLIEVMDSKLDLVNEAGDESLPKRVSALEVRVTKLEKKQK